jgi:hypothetical protein
VGQEVTRRDHGRGRKSHVLGHHGRVVVAALREICDQLLVGECVRINRLDLPMRRDRSRLVSLVPLPKLLPPDLFLEHLFGPLEALRDVLLRGRSHRVVGETVYVHGLHPVDEHPVVAGEIIGTLPHRRRVGFCKITGHRSRKMNGIERP